MCHSTVDHSLRETAKLPSRAKSEQAVAEHATVSEVCRKMADLPNSDRSSQAAAEHATDFDPPIYNIWKQ
jgi:hypothetical protein